MVSAPRPGKISLRLYMTKSGTSNSLVRDDYSVIVLCDSTSTSI